MANKKVLDYLKQLDFSEIEGKMYLSLLEYGPLSVKDLAKTISINRTSAYTPINSLIEKGVLIEITKNTRKQLAALEPDHLHFLIDRKFDSVKSMEAKFPEIINTINVTLNKKPVGGKVVVKYYQGKNNAIALYREAFKAKILRSFVKILEHGGLFTDNMTVFNKALVQNKNLRIKEIIYDSSIVTRQLINTELLAKHQAYSYKLMPQNIKWAGNDILIYDGKIAIVEFEKNIESIVLQSESYFNNFKELFDFVWQLLPDPSPHSSPRTL